MRTDPERAAYRYLPTLEPIRDHPLEKNPCNRTRNLPAPPGSPPKPKTSSLQHEGRTLRGRESRAVPPDPLGTIRSRNPLIEQREVQKIKINHPFMFLPRKW